MINPKHTARAQVLAAMPGTQADIRRKTGLGSATVSRWVDSLRCAAECHVHEWVRSARGGPYSEVLHAGPGANATHTRTVKAVPKGERYNLEMRTSEGVSGRTQGRIPAWVGKPIKRCPMTTAFFGAA